jgi:flagellar biosynthesis GTPase FlhF
MADRRVKTTGRNPNVAAQERSHTLRHRYEVLGLQRHRETSEDREARLDTRRLRRRTQNSEEREARLEMRRQQASLRRRTENSEEREARLEMRRQQASLRRRTENSDEREARLEMRRQAKRQKSFHMQQPDANNQQAVVVEEHDIGSMCNNCEYCIARYWGQELNTSKKYTKCCHDGKVTLDPLSETPTLLTELLMGNTPEANNYREYIREYNSAMAFASMGADIKSPPGNGPHCFRIHGQIYHLVSPLYPNESNKPGYGQLYIYDSTEATTIRLKNQSNQGCMANVMQQLDEMLRQVTPFAESYKQMHQITQANLTMNVRMVFIQDPNLDNRRYNAPTSKTEVAAIFVGEDGEPPANTDICIYPTGDSCRIISPLNKNGDPMVYSLLFPSGEGGCHVELQHAIERRSAQRIRVTQLQFYALDQWTH